VVVVGAGIFGCAIAYALANQNRSVLLLERWMTEPDRIVGELLQPGGVRALRKLGLASCLEGIDAVPCHGYHVIYHGDDVVIPYPAVDSNGQVQVNTEPRLGAAEMMMLLEKDGRQRQHANGTAAATTGHANGHANGSAIKQQQQQHSTRTKAAQGDAKRPEGRSFHHGRFISQLRRACQRHPNITVVETEVTATIQGTHSPQVLGVEARTTIDKGETTASKRADFFFGQLTIIADGYASRFRKQYVDRMPVVRSKFYALELLDCPLAPTGFGHVVIGAAYPVLLYQIGTRETRALFDVPLDLPAAAAERGGVRGYIRDVVLPTLPAPVRPSVVAALAALGPTAIPRSMPNSWLPPRRAATQHPGVLLLGDAFNMRHPLTGGGMTVAFHDALLVADLLAPGAVPDLGDAAAVAAAMGAFYARRKRLTSIINVLAQALYSLFAAGAGDPAMRALQRGCFQYFRDGYTDEPVAMLGGLLATPLTLARHFFTVAFLAIWLHARDDVLGWGRGASAGGGGSSGALSVFGLLWLPLALLDAVRILWRACVVFLPTMYREAF